MWGQGVLRHLRYAQLIANGIGHVETREPEIVHDLSRSGAKIRARGDRESFVDTYPHLFPGGRGIAAFLDGRDDTPATGLYGEVPATFPTIRGQLSLMSDAIGRTVDIALLDGGINDVEIEDIVDPRVETGHWIEHYDGAVRTVAFDDVFDLITLTRRKCPNALIMYFGFFPALSYKSDTGKIRDFMKHEYGDDVAWWFNEHVYEVVDVNDLIREGIVRALWLQGRWQYWTRKAVVAANHDAAIRGPGVVFVPSGFEEENAVFAPTPYLWDDPYDPTSDDARAVRVENIPRQPQLDAMRKLLSNAGQLRSLDPSASSAWKIELAATVRQEASELLAALNGPTSLRRALQNLDTDDAGTIEAARAALANEIGRVQHAMIASLSHPNERGAATYAENALTRYKRFHEVANVIKQQALHPNAPVMGETVEQLLSRCGLRGDGPLMADADHLDVDSIAIRVVTDDASDDNLLPDVWLVISTKSASHQSYLLNFKYKQVKPPGGRVVVVSKFYPHFEPGTTTLFTVDTAGKLRLGEIVGCSLVLGPDPYAGKAVVGYGTVWRPRYVRIEVNGMQVIDVSTAGQEIRPGQRLDLHWPAPEPGFVAPKLATVRLAKARALGVPAKQAVVRRVRAESVGVAPRRRRRS